MGTARFAFKKSGKANVVLVDNNGRMGVKVRQE